MERVPAKICDILVESGIEHVFGMPGGGTIPIYDALYDKQDKIKTIMVRHEQAAACMADAYGRLTGKPAVIMGQGAFMGSSATFGVMEAYLASYPMLLLTDTSDSRFPQQANYQCGTGDYGGIDLLGVFRSVGKYAVLATTAKEAVQGVQLAIKHSVSGRPGPACVVMRTAAIQAEVDPDAAPRVYPSGGYLNTIKPVAPEEEIRRLIGILASAENPVLIAGNGVHAAKAYQELEELAELYSMPVATSYKGKSAFPETHPLALGMIGAFGQRTANTIVGEADVLLVVGCKLSPSDTMAQNPDLIDPTRQRIIQIDIEPRNAGWTYPVEIGLVGDAKAILRQILRASSEVVSKKEERIELLGQRKRELSFFEDAEVNSDATPILPQRLVRLLEEALDSSAIIALDAGNNRVWMSHYYRTKEAGTMLCPGGIAGMGWAPPAALAAKVLYPYRPCISVSGDGGFMMAVHVLSTACQYDLPAIFVVMNNSELGMIRRGQGNRVIATEFMDTDHAKIAQAFGCEGIRVEKPQELAPAVKQAIASRKPTVIDVIIQREEGLAKIRGGLARRR